LVRGIITRDDTNLEDIMQELSMNYDDFISSLALTKSTNYKSSSHHNSRTTNYSSNLSDLISDIVKKSHRNKKKVVVHHLLFLNGDISTSYPTIEKIENLKAFFDTEEKKTLHKIKNLEDDGIYLSHESFFIYLPVE